MEIYGLIVDMQIINSSGHEFSTLASVLKLPNIMIERNKFNAFVLYVPTSFIREN